MQKKLIALAVVGMMSGVSFAQTSVTIGGKFDMGYQFKHSAIKDSAAGGSAGGGTTETMGDGGASTSRITVQAKEQINDDLSTMVDLDLRFGTVEEGKGITQDATGKVTSVGGISTNDKKGLYLQSKRLGNLRWGVINTSHQQYWDYEEKPYMINIKDLEIVKYGISTKRFTALTNRNTSYDTPVLTLGAFQTRLKGNYAIGDARKSGGSNVSSQGSGDAYTVANTATVGKWVNWTLGTGHRVSTNNLAATRNGMNWQEYSANIHPLDGLKIGTSLLVYKGYTGTGAVFEEKNTNFVLAYNYASLWQVGVERSHLNDLSETRNSGKGWMIGGSYFLSKNTYLYAAWQKDDFARNDTAASTGGYDGTKDGFIGSFTKGDMTYTRVGIVKEF